MRQRKLNFWFYLPPILLLIFFIVLMNGAGFLQKSVYTNGHFPALAAQLAASIRSENPSQALDDLAELTAAWQKVHGYIQIAAEKEKLEAINENLARLEALLQMQDFPAALSELYATLNHWNTISQ